MIDYYTNVPYIAEKLLIKKYNVFFNCKIVFRSKIISFLITNYMNDSDSCFRNLLQSIYTELKFHTQRYLNFSLDKYKFKIQKKHIFNILGNKKKKHDKIGQVTGLAYDTHKDSGIIIPIEVVFVKGSGQLIISSNVRQLMKESILVALSILKDNDYKNDDFWNKHDIHVNVALALKDVNGASAGITFYTALVSCIKNIHVKSNIAMTGKLTREGAVIPIGGVEGKLLAAIRNKNINTVLLPKKNKKDVEYISNFIKRKIKIIYVKNIYEVIFNSLEAPKYLLRKY